MFNRLIDIYFWFCSVMAGVIIFAPRPAFAFTKLKNGFEVLTISFLIPLLYGVAGAAFIFYAIYSLFKQEEKKKMGEVAAIAAIGAAGLDLINKIIQSFS